MKNLTLLLICFMSLKLLATLKQESVDLTALPLDKGLPVVVRVGVYFQAISAFEENKKAFDATVDMRLRWEDPRLRYPAEEVLRGFYEYRGLSAQNKLSQIWSPGVSFANMKGEPSYQTTSLRVFPTGWVELMQRNTAQFSVKIDASAFPFDRQMLGIEVSLRKQTTGEASLVFLQEDLDFSHAAKDISLSGWSPELVSIKRANTAGWYGDVHSGLIVGLSVVRQSAKVVFPIFIPLLASLLIPLLIIWMNRTKNGEFEVEAFQLANIVVGGLFAVIAHNFTVNSEYSVVSSGDNTVTRLFGLNYTALALSLSIIVLLYQYNVPKRIFGRYVQEQIFACLIWSVPLVVFGTALAFVMIAAA